MTRARNVGRSATPENLAELLLELGKRVRRRIMHGVELGTVSRKLRSTPAYCQLALAFVNSHDLLKLRAMVEDWSDDRIVQELGGATRIWPELATAAN